jgi:hypothetical protein
MIMLNDEIEINAPIKASVMPVSMPKKEKGPTRNRSAGRASGAKNLDSSLYVRLFTLPQLFTGRKIPYAFTVPIPPGYTPESIRAAAQKQVQEVYGVTGASTARRIQWGGSDLISVIVDRNAKERGWDDCWAAVCKAQRGQKKLIGDL